MNTIQCDKIIDKVNYETLQCSARRMLCANADNASATDLRSYDRRDGRSRYSAAVAASAHTKAEHALPGEVDRVHSVAARSSQQQHLAATRR